MSPAHRRASPVRSSLSHLLAGLTLLIATATAAADTGAIVGKVIDARDQQILIGHAAVFICDASDGRPFQKDTFEQIGTEGAEFQGLANLTHAVTDPQGNFEISGVPVGKYRLVAQSWLGQAGVPDREDPSETVFLHGVVNDVEVTSGETTRVFIRPLGTARMTLINDPEEEHAFLVLSTAARRGDPVLAYPFWGEKFATHAIGITLMETHKVTFHGLPEGQLHAGLYNYDNNPGVGGASFSVVDGQTARIPVYATWSNGKFDPPASLLPLVEHLEQNNISVKELLKAQYPDDFTGEPNRNSTFSVFLKHGDDELAVQGFGNVRMLDLAAAENYRRLRAHHLSKRNRSKETKNSPQP